MFGSKDDHKYGLLLSSYLPSDFIITCTVLKLQTFHCHTNTDETDESCNRTGGECPSEMFTESQRGFQHMQAFRDSCL